MTYSWPDGFGNLNYIKGHMYDRTLFFMVIAVIVPFSKKFKFDPITLHFPKKQTHKICKLLIGIFMYMSAEKLFSPRYHDKAIQLVPGFLQFSVYAR